MRPPFSAETYEFILVAYLAIIAAVNFIAFLISNFYRKKFNQPAPRLSYCLAIGLNLLACASILLQGHSSPLARNIQIFLLLGSGLLSIYGSIALFFTMNKVRK